MMSQNNESFTSLENGRSHSRSYSKALKCKDILVIAGFLLAISGFGCLIGKNLLDNGWNESEIQRKGIQNLFIVVQVIVAFLGVYIWARFYKNSGTANNLENDENVSKMKN